MTAEEAILRAARLCEESAAFAEAQRPIAREAGLDLAFAAWSGASASCRNLAKAIREMGAAADPSLSVQASLLRLREVAELARTDPERAGVEADRVVARILRDLGQGAVADAWEALPLWRG